MDLQHLTFEQAYQELLITVQTLEQDNLPLDEMITLYQKGMQLTQYCNQKLDQAELSVKQLDE
ncbi:exodeoxyribonuclease VII small subunit [Anaerolineales bacterium HSG25]|nr:exodeoxyribonuclease VII small subunit [Anaerolineales bacterium HSG25]